jgi:hypothetical protein
MKATLWLCVPSILLLLALGCTYSTPNSGRPSGPDVGKAGPASANDEEADIAKNMAMLSPEDRKLAESQKFCANEEDNRLGSMGVPIKVMLKDKPVFICCKSCKGEVESDPDKYIARAEEMRAKSGAPKK